MKRYLYVTGAVFLIVAGAIGIARANLPCLQHGPGRFPLAYLSRELNLTDSQRDQIISMGKAELPRIRPLLRQFLDGLNEMPTGTRTDLLMKPKLVPLPINRRRLCRNCWSNGSA